MTQCFNGKTTPTYQKYSKNVLDNILRFPKMSEMISEISENFLKVFLRKVWTSCEAFCKDTDESHAVIL